MKIKHLFAAMLLPTVLGAWAAPFTVSTNQEEVTDTATGLVWRRCAEGATAIGNTCTGNDIAFTHEQALSRASGQAASSGVAWRLPNIKELSSIIDKTRKNPAIDIAAFPAASISTFWSSSPYVANSSSAWHVDFNLGGVSSGKRIYANSVRLVRAGQ